MQACGVWVKNKTESPFIYLKGLSVIFILKDIIYLQNPLFFLGNESPQFQQRDITP
ncbi:hypothetical protein J2Y60_003597 [Arcicella sp. BE140]|nr:hypothetical protein [Arcicella sp. BE51]MDR6813386.1 hypothetical protein [Arcicella sp. BE140]MDR6824699.1 hypothetical protein [Arcicella sp. BE139]